MKLAVDVPSSSYLSSDEGELVLVEVRTEPRALEDLLECLAGLSFPINPQIFHGVPTRVEFPAWKGWLPELEGSLRSFGFDPASLAVQPMLKALTE